MFLDVKPCNFMNTQIIGSHVDQNTFIINGLDFIQARV